MKSPILAAICIALALSAQAADFSAPILDLDGKKIVDDTRCPEDATTKKRACEDPVTLSAIAIRALLAPYPDEQNLPGEEKLKRFALALKIKDGGQIELSPEDAALIKRLIGKLYTAVVVGRAYPLLDPSLPK